MHTPRILTVGLDPYLLDFTAPEFAAFPGVTAQTIATAVNAANRDLLDKGYDADMCWTDEGATAADVFCKKLQQKEFDIVMIAPIIHLSLKYLPLFETMINLVRQYAPDAVICFNSSPMDIVATVERTLKNVTEKIG